MILRLTGIATEVGDKPWSTRDGSRSGSMPSATVQLNDFVSTEVTLAPGLAAQLTVGKVADLVIEVEPNGGFLRARAVNLWPKGDTYSAAVPTPIHAAARAI